LTNLAGLVQCAALAWLALLGDSILAVIGPAQ
jgi:hypothetical protein